MADLDMRPHMAAVGSHPPIRLAIPDQLVDLLPRFVAEMARDCRILAGLIGGGRDLIAEHAHAMRGKCAMFGAVEMAELLGELEGMAPVAGARDVDRLVARIIGRAHLLALYNESIAHRVAEHP